MVTINGKELTLSSPTTVAQYLQQNGYQVNRIAVELNYEILPKTSYGETLLRDGDIMEVVSFVGGG